MIKYRVGDLIKAVQDGEVNAFAHQANCFCTMQSGIAPKLAKAFPGIRSADNTTERGDRKKLGDMTCCLMIAGGLDVIGFNLYGQYHCVKSHPEYGTDYGALDNALARMRAYLDNNAPSYNKVGFPLIGCGLAGGDWKVVSHLIETAFKGFDGEVIVYTLEPMDGLNYESEKPENR